MGSLSDKFIHNQFFFATQTVIHLRLQWIKLPFGNSTDKKPEILHAADRPHDTQLVFGYIFFREGKKKKSQDLAMAKGKETPYLGLIPILNNSLRTMITVTLLADCGYQLLLLSNISRCLKL